MSLFRLPCVTQTERLTPKIAAMSSLTVVLPLLPVTATSGIVNDARQARAIAPSARRESRTSICGSARRGEARHERAGGALRERFVDEVVAVEAVAGDRDEQRAGAERARVRRHGAERPDPRRRDGPAPRARRRPACAPSWRDSEQLGDDRAVAESAPLAADELLCLVAFARDEHDVADVARARSPPRSRCVDRESR